MIHKTKLRNYKDLDALSEEIGDLRYDTLCEFLVLLSQKLKRDGEKDLARGRSKLASSLIRAGKGLEMISDDINNAWLISRPYLQYVFPGDIRQHIKINFPESDYTAIILLLYDLHSDTSDDAFRIIRSLLYVSSGNTEKLKAELRNLDDYRDLLLSAEYDEGTEMKRNFNNPFGEEHKLDTGFKDNAGFGSDDDLPF